MNISLIQNFDDLPPRAEWNDLAADSPFQSWEWLSSWWDAFGADLDLNSVEIRNDANELIGFAPWYLHSSRTRGRVLRFLGDGKACSDYATILTRRGSEIDVRSALGQWLSQSDDRVLRWDGLEFDGVLTNDPIVESLTREIAIGVQAKDAQRTWTIPLPATWTEYLMNRGKRRRNMLRRLEREFISSGRAEFEIANSIEQVESFLSSLIQLHTLRRNEVGCGGCFSDRRFAVFLATAVARLFDADRLWLTQLKIDGHVVANSIGLTHQRGVFLYQCGFDPDWGRARPGWIQNIFNLKKAIQAGYQTFDFLRGDELYKQQLGGEPAVLWRYRAAAPRAMPALRHNVRSSITTLYRSFYDPEIQRG